MRMFSDTFVPGSNTSVMIKTGEFSTGTFGDYSSGTDTGPPFGTTTCSIACMTKVKVDDGFMLEVLTSRTNVITQRGFDKRGYGGLNP
jgi:spore cortex formation protein SpoVR/YcgB (stage V sporulation)